MAIVVDMHKHISTATEGRSYFPWQQRWHVCMNWAYGKEARKLGDPRDPEALYPRQDIRMADPEGKWAVQDMDEGGVDVSVCLPIDYSFSHGSESSIGIEEKQQHLAEMQEKYPGRIIGFAGPDPRRPGAVEILTRGIIPNFKTDAESVGRLLGRARDVVGAHNMLYGTDTHSGPSVHGDTLFRRDSGFNLGGAIAWLRDLPNTARQYGVDFTNEEVDMILGESAARLLGIKEYPKRETPHTFGWKRRSPSVYRGGA